MEVCVDSVESALNAAAGGASRLELCAALSEGGLTPTPATAKTIKSLVAIPVLALIRPRTGDFLYSQHEADIMEQDIRSLVSAGADGFVLGALDAHGRVDVATCSRLVSACQGLPVTFHRAFDMAADPDEAMEAVLSLGCLRLLTSGQEATAAQGKELLRRLVNTYGRRVIVMPGGGVTEANLEDLLVSTGASEFHASARVAVQSRMQFRNQRCAMGGAGQDDFLVQTTSVERVANMVAIYQRTRSK